MKFSMRVAQSFLRIGNDRAIFRPRMKCQGLTDKQVQFAKNFGDDAEALASSMAFMEQVQGLENQLNIFASSSRNRKGKGRSSGS